MEYKTKFICETFSSFNIIGYSNATVTAPNYPSAVQLEVLLGTVEVLLGTVTATVP